MNALHGRLDHDVDVVIVGAGPTGLSLAAQLRSFGTRFRIVDRSLDRTRESRALAVQARSLELMDSVGLGDPLVALGNTSARLVLHLGARPVAQVALGSIGATDTRYPFILFVSQAETERVLGDHLSRSGVAIERGVELESFKEDEDAVHCVLRHPGGHREVVSCAFLTGCDGAHSSVRKLAGFEFEGGSYPQEFVLGDVEADGPLEAGAINSFTGGGGVAMFFPLGAPTTWRVIAMRAPDRSTDREQPEGDSEAPVGPLTLDELQEVVSPPTGGSVTVRDPAWLTQFRLHHRQIAHYRSGRVFLAGDAAHIHSPVGAQGMNTGIQDAWNLGWKLALVASGAANPTLLDSYEAERWPVGRFLLRYTDRVFGTFTRAMSTGRIATWVRELVIPHVIPRALESRRLRAAAFRFVSELGIDYRRSPAVEEGEPRLKGGPRAGDRLPDGRVTLDGKELALQHAAVGARLTLLLCGEPDRWDAAQTAALEARTRAPLGVVHLWQGERRGVLVDRAGDMLSRLGARDGAQYLVRPDGYVAFRCAGYDVAAVRRYVDAWYLLTSTLPSPR